MPNYVYVPKEEQDTPVHVQAVNRVEAKQKLRARGLQDDPHFIDGDIEEVFITVKSTNYAVYHNAN